ncbi:mRNA 3' end processing factor [Dipsacomyces acuminosporus]|nr:mRNA 3' end processing factor [Dipsacomyces acuminosporus]
MAEINKTLYRMYRGELNALTFNSKPIINRLTEIAGENMREAPTILKALQDHLRMAGPKTKLPAFYLLDSIAKNVGHTYVHLLSNGLIKTIFMDTWRSVADNVRKEMERVLKTWREGFLGGSKNLFQPFVLRGIDEELNRLKAKASREAPISTTDGMDIMDKLTNTAQSYAKKRSLEQQYSARKQPSSASHPAVPPEKRPKTPVSSKEPFNPSLLQEVNRIMLKKQVEQLRKPNDASLYEVVSILSRIKQLVAETVLPDDQVALIRKQIADIDSNQDMSNGLSKIAPSITSLLGAGGSPDQPQFPYESYTKLKQLEPIPLTHASVTRNRPGIYNILYKGYPNACKQCGWRSDDSEAGVKRMDQHLDWHFRRNRRSQEDRVRKANPRGWYVGQESWEAATAHEEAANGAGAAANGMAEQAADAANGTNKAAAGSGQQGDGGSVSVEELRELAVTVPTDHNNQPCPICKEPFERRFNEDEEDWEFVNAVLVDGTVYHATCRADLADAAVPAVAAAGSTPGTPVAS